MGLILSIPTKLNTLFALTLENLARTSEVSLMRVPEHGGIDVKKVAEALNEWIEPNVNKGW